MSEEGVRSKRKRQEILGGELAKRGIRYPAWQILEGRQLLPTLPRLFEMLGNDPWRLFRFKQQRDSELGGARAPSRRRHCRCGYRHRRIFLTVGPLTACAEPWGAHACPGAHRQASGTTSFSIDFLIRKGSP
jgi:hypothetical protein